MRVVCDENIPGLGALQAAGMDAVRLPGRAISARDVVAADALLVRSVTRVDGALLHGSRVRFVGTATSGIDHIHLPDLERANVAFAHAPGANANSVVEYVLSAIVGVEDCWARLAEGACIGIIGYGHIGRLLVARLQALGFAYRVYDPWLAEVEVPARGTLDDVLACPVISVHASLTDAQPWPSRHLLGRAELSQIADSTLLINASRGAVIDNAALRLRLDQGRGPITVLDVWEGEPTVDSGLLRRVRFGTAHIAGYSWDGKLLATRMLLRAMDAVLGTRSADGGLADAAPVLRLPPVEGAPALARQLLQARYDIRLDDKLLREALAPVNPDNDEPGRGEAFDALRRGYRRRRELAGSAVVDTGWSAAQRQLALGLGCRIVANGAALAE